MIEYKVEEVASTTSAGELQDRLNALARDRWALTAVDPRPEGDALYIFERPAREESEPKVAGFGIALTPKTENS